MSQAERRRAGRIIRSFMVRYKSFAAGEGAWLTSTLRNFSAGGARFLCEREFRARDAMLLQLLLPTAREPIALKARVAWTQPASLGMVDLGVAFEPSDARAAGAIAQAARFFTAKTKEAA
jgi:Tfp pilus assembly protein PilZ